MSPLSASSPRASPLPPPTLRVGTFNLGLGLLRKLPAILSRATSLSLDLLALQEVGDPPLLNHKQPGYSILLSPGPSAHEAGVALLISHRLASRCRDYKRSASGRLVGVVLELSKGSR